MSNSDSYHQDQANKTGKPVYVGPDNLNGGSHWIYPETKTNYYAKVEGPSVAKSRLPKLSQNAQVMLDMFIATLDKAIKGVKGSREQCISDMKNALDLIVAARGDE